MPIKTRSSSSKDLSGLDPVSTTETSTSTDSGIDSSDNLDVLTKVLDSIRATNDSIKANQVAIDAINTKLMAHSVSMITTHETLATLDATVNTLTENFATLPGLFETNLADVQQNLRLEFSGNLTDLNTKLCSDLSSQRNDMTACFKNHVTTITALGNDLLTTTKNLTALQESTLSRLDVERIVVQKWEDELDPHIKSHYDLKQETTTRFDALDDTIKDIVDERLKAHTISSSPQIIRSSSSNRSVGFSQPISKDFSVSKLQKELKEIKLSSDALKDIEIFWDTILGAFTNLCQITQAYPYYRDLQPTFSFEVHFVESVMPPRFLPAEYDQAKRNYKSFGDIIRIFLHSGTAIIEASSPKAYLQLLSLSDVHDGFLLLRDLVFSLSPQLLGHYYDFRHDIDTLTIISGEHLSKFYQRVIKLSTEITLSKIQNGNMALLAFRFLSLLRSTKCQTIIGLVTPYWKQITQHRRNPKHLLIPLPWSFKDVYDDLICSDISYLNVPTDDLILSGPTPIAARGFSQATSHSTNSTRHLSTSRSSPLSTTIGIHKTKDGRKFISHNNTVLHPKKPLCQLCFNKHVNPWHPTENCPYKHPTQIIPRDVRERVMQHNAIHGAEKKDYTKTQDTPHAATSPPQATGNSATTLESSHIPIIPTEQPENNIDSSSPSAASTQSFEDTDEIIDTEYFDIPFPPATANMATTSNTQQFEDIDSASTITDHLQYLSYDS